LPETGTPGQFILPRLPSHLLRPRTTTLGGVVTARATQPDLFVTPSPVRGTTPKYAPNYAPPDPGFDFHASAEEWANTPGGPIPEWLRIPLVDDPP
jgi:hypothetical protein